jgi:hypothetical protein
VEEETQKGVLVGENIFSEIMKYPETDTVVFFYRSLLKSDRDMLSFYLEIKKYFKE